MPIRRRDKALMLETDLSQKRFQEASDNAKQGASKLSPALRAAIFKSLKEHQQRGEAADAPTEKYLHFEYDIFSI